MHAVRVTLLLLSSLLVAACATVPPAADRPAFGETVRHMIQVQTYEPGDEVPSLHGDRAATSMGAYRRDASDPGRFGKGRMELD